MCEGSKGKQRQQIPRKRAGKHCTANKVSGHLPVRLCYQLLAPNGQNIVLQQIVQLARAKKKSRPKWGETPFKTDPERVLVATAPFVPHQLLLLLTIWKIYQKIQGAGYNMTPSDRPSVQA